MRVEISVVPYFDKRGCLCQNRERTGVPARAARVGWWMRPGHRLHSAREVSTIRVSGWVKDSTSIAR
jgi:hypothetical protein